MGERERKKEGKKRRNDDSRVATVIRCAICSKCKLMQPASDSELK